ncbi:hypothetical protein [Dasania marina]|uniref:hypothetical protein n=1 Tax=Dasania marina TaxID=471499 RepID=UPI0030D74B3B|tara:strand:+ start:72765 stop:73313 length:549 start_codon:yes stop_codon:yes gene_type:complete
MAAIKVIDSMYFVDECKSMSVNYVRKDSLVSLINRHWIGYAVKIEVSEEQYLLVVKPLISGVIERIKHEDDICLNSIAFVKRNGSGGFDFYIGFFQFGLENNGHEGKMTEYKIYSDEGTGEPKMDEVDVSRNECFFGVRDGWNSLFISLLGSEEMYLCGDILSYKSCRTNHDVFSSARMMVH